MMCAAQESLYCAPHMNIDKKVPPLATLKRTFRHMSESLEGLSTCAEEMQTPLQEESHL